MKSIGSLMLLLFCLVPAAWPQPMAGPKHQQYTLYDLGTLGGPNSTTSYFATSLTGQGAIGTAQTGSADPLAPYCMLDVIFGWGCSAIHAFQWKGGTLIDLGSLKNADNSSWAFSINNYGLAAGFSETGFIDSNGYPETHPVVWNHGELIDLDTFGGTQGTAAAVNDRGQVVGWASNAIGDDFSSAFESLGLSGTWPLTTQVRAFVWERGMKQDLGTLGGPDALAYAINQRGQITGYSFANDTPNSETGIPTVHSFLWENGKMTDLGTLGGTKSTPMWLNDRGQVVGTSTLAGDQLSHGFLWEHGILSDLLPLSGGSYSVAFWINEASDVVGGSAIAGDEVTHAVLWSGGKAWDLGAIGQDTCSEAWSINDSRQIVGHSFPCSDYWGGRAFLWESGSIVDLNALVENPTDLILGQGTYITDRGLIVAQGMLPNGDVHTAVLVPHGDCGEACQRRIIESQENRFVSPHAGKPSLPFAGPHGWLQNPFGPRYAIPDRY
ncbi:exported hypothetical protein [Candidatus Sulfotelmatomonas gaucii]|uniref:Extracellular repeat protein, HAF family n=1 Tax=Candidatus Sulfuritelmatomonas gaucii TaxID=2043161 RepID=A0A2N9LJ27_9BACT|nr:exported hypothetical protein [Candidatus Sulfotelmatomonas gaucii]